MLELIGIDAASAANNEVVDSSSFNVLDPNPFQIVVDKTP